MLALEKIRSLNTHMKCNLDVNNVITSEHNLLMSKSKAAAESKDERSVLC